MVALKKSLSQIKSGVGKKIPSRFKKWLKTPAGKAVLVTGASLTTALIIWRFRGRHIAAQHEKQLFNQGDAFIEKSIMKSEKTINKTIDEKLPEISKKISEDIAMNISSTVPFKTIGLKEAEYKQTLTKIKMSEKDQKLKEKIIKKNVLLKEDKNIKKKEKEIQKLSKKNNNYKNQQKLQKLQYEKSNLKIKHQATKDFLKSTTFAARKRNRRSRRSKRSKRSRRSKRSNKRSNKRRHHKI